MTRLLTNRRSWLLALLAGTMPLGTVATCDYSGAGGTLFYDHVGHHDYDGGALFIDSGPYGYVDDHYYYDDVVIVDDYYYDDYYYDDYYYDDCSSFWDCWW